VSRQRVDRRSRFSFWGGLSSVAFGLLLLVGVLFPTTAGATVRAATTSTIALHNNTAGPATDCPPGGGAFWHFVFAPNNGKTAFVTITLNLDGDVVVFSGAQIIPNGGQLDNVFVAVPSDHVLSDLETSGSFATYSGATPKLFNLSSICEGAGTTTTTEGTTTTSEGTTTTSEGTTTTSEGTTTTSEGTTTTSEGTTTTSEGTTTTSEGTTTTTIAGIAVTPSTAPSQVLGASVTTASSGTLPVTGSNATFLATIGAALVAGGLVLVLASRRRAGARP
jgi:LPXTG-motif cell wall-anchored protein